MSDAGRENVIGQEYGSFVNRELLHVGGHNRGDFISSLYANILTPLCDLGFILLAPRYKKKVRVTITTPLRDKGS